MYDFDSLKLILENAGFNRVRKLTPGKGKMVDLAFLENNDDIKHVSLYIEAEK